MSTVQEKLKLKRVPSNIWSIREQLCLASSVVKSGDQNWISVSRSIKQIVDKDSLQPPDRYSQKSCAQQYSYLMENADAPKKKKKESSETISESIVRRLTQDRITELTKILAAQRDEYFQLRNEVNLLKNGTVSDEKLQKMWLAIEEEKNKSQAAMLNKKQQNKDVQLAAISNVQNLQRKISESPIKTETEVQIKTEGEEKKENKCTKSSLLTSLLKTQSSTSGPIANSTTQIQTPTTTSPTIANLLCSSPKVPATSAAQNTLQLSQTVPNTTSNVAVQERPSTSAPTLSMLLEQPSTGSQKVLQQQLHNASSLINSKDAQIPVQAQNSVQTRSSRFVLGNDSQSKQMSVTSDSQLTSAEIPQIIANPIDEVMKMNKDEINEIIGDIEELIKEEITGSPKTLDSSLEAPQVFSGTAEQTVTETKIENQKTRSTDELTPLSNSPASEMYVGEIDSSTSNIAEIIGTTIDAVNSKANIPDMSRESSKFTSPNIDNAIDPVSSKENNLSTEIIKPLSQKENEVKDTVINKEKSLVTNKLNINYEKKEQDNKKEKKTHECNINIEKNESQCSISGDTNKNIADFTCDKRSLNETTNISSDENIPFNLKKNEKTEKSHREQISNDKTIFHNMQGEEKKKWEKNKSNEKGKEIETIHSLEDSKNESKKICEINIIEMKQEIDEADDNLYDSEKVDKDTTESTKNLNKKSDVKKKQTYEGAIKEDSTIKHCKTNDDKKLEENKGIVKNESVLKKNKVEESTKNKAVKKDDKLSDDEKVYQVKIEPKKEDYNDITKVSNKEEKEIKKENESTIKKENVETIGSAEELDEEPVVNKLSANKAMKTYSKKQNTTIDSEPENEASGETADYKSWKKLIMSVYNTLATHKYASIFLRPITEDQAPGYHSIIFRPMDLLTIKKNIDNGTIRSTAHFQRDVMLMFQNAIMFNKHNTFVHKMTLEMREECLQHMQIFVQAAGEASSREHNRRETRTAANISNETPDNILKRKWVHMTSSPHEIESPRVKKRRKSEND